MRREQNIIILVAVAIFATGSFYAVEGNANQRNHARHSVFR